MVRNLVIGAALVATAAVGLPAQAVAHDRDRGWYQGGDDDWDDDDGDRDRRYYRERGSDYARPGYYGYSRGYYNQPRYRCRTKGTTGLIIGGAAGALLGQGITRDRTTGALIGGAAGALLGREVTRRNRC